MLYGWLPDAVLEDVVASFREHQAVEFSNWLESAYRGALSGMVLLSRIDRFDYPYLVRILGLYTNIQRVNTMEQNYSSKSTDYFTKLS